MTEQLTDLEHHDDGDGDTGPVDLDGVEVVSVSGGAVGAARAEAIDLSLSALGAARAESVAVDTGAVGIVVADDAHIDTAMVGPVFAREAHLERFFAQTVIAQRVEVSGDSLTVFLVAQRVEGSVRAIFDWRGALAFGAAFGLIVGLLRLGRRG
jgi:hypothetical protein